MSSGTKTTADYIQHHLTNLTYGQLPDGSWGFAHSGAEAAQMGFWSVNVDSMVWSIVLGLVFAIVFRTAAYVGNSWRTRRPAKFC
jgi:F-type H+-transporting ATPase subunit a